MAQFSTSDINDAKRRVQQMHQRARNVVNEQGIVQEDSTPPPVQPRINNSVPQQASFGISSFLKSLGVGGEKESSSGLILALILILSHEKADNMLILALLYILL